MNYKLLICFVLLSLTTVSAQSTIDKALIEIAKNNKTIQANTQYWNAQKIQYKTGNTLYNPTVEYDYLKGTPANAGNQTDIVVTQSFDFPTAYGKKNHLAKEKTNQADLQLKSANQAVLLEAKKVCIELVYRNKFQIPLTTRKEATERWLVHFKKRMYTGDGTILDVNKAEIQLLELRKQFQDNSSAIAVLNEKVTALNGGTPIPFTDLTYYDVPAIADFETLFAEIELVDYVKKTLEQEKVIAQKQIEVSKALALPKMEVGSLSRYFGSNL